ncbi:TetR/AcrR family transcriptional regulator [Cohnella sp. WQ 127256]|uniref:TetR/AcrR family transcriptional regulator n=1 Tax=Cohnella sp. WQ 127256 TaxID=2938790 RepID=UPI0021189640|nr:TetR/AcrR family transcriptional regulator [Cohnella sp. WQ 127256]
MQILKDEIRNRIVLAALKEFKRIGYTKASMRQIAQEAGVTSGNIYRYYTNKEQLFDAIVQPVYEQFTEYMLDISQDLDLRNTQKSLCTVNYFSKIESTIVELFKTYSSELMILLNRSAGSKYETAKSDLIQLTFCILEKVVMKAKGSNAALNDNDKEIALVRMLASTIVEGICIILRDNEEGDTLKALVDQFLYVYSEGITGLIKQMS